MIVFRIIKFCFIYTWEVIYSTLTIAKLVITPKPELNPCFIDIPLTLQGDYTRFLFACLISMTPGTLSVALDPEQKTLLVHCISCDDPEAMIAEIKHKFERPLIESFERKLL